MPGANLPREARPFPCPRGCLFTLGGIKRFATFKGWRKHMDEKHEGPTSEELDAINAILSADSKATKSQAQLEQEAVSSEQQFDSEGNPIPAAPDPVQEATERKKRQSSEQKRINREINDKMAEVQKLIFEGIPKMIFNGLAASQQSDTFLLTATQEKMIHDSFDLASKGMGVNWEIEPWNFTVKNPLWLLLCPFAVIAVIFIGKKRKVDAERASVQPSV